MKQYFRQARRLSAIIRGEAFERVDKSGRIRKISRTPRLASRSLHAGGSKSSSARDEEFEQLEREQG
jgi:hypothetical protein